MITQCSSPVEGSNDESVKDPPAESTVEQPTASVPGSSDEPCERPLQEPLGEDQKVLPKEPLLTLNLPDEIKGTVFHFTMCFKCNLILDPAAFLITHSKTN